LLGFPRKCRKTLQLLEISLFQFDVHHDYARDLFSFFDLIFDLIFTEPPHPNRTRIKSCTTDGTGCAGPFKAANAQPASELGTEVCDQRQNSSTCARVAVYPKFPAHLPAEKSLRSESLHSSRHIKNAKGCW